MDIMQQMFIYDPAKRLTVCAGNLQFNIILHPVVLHASRKHVHAVWVGCADAMGHRGGCALL